MVSQDRCMRAAYVVFSLVQKYSDVLSLLQYQTLIRSSYGKTSEPLTLVKQCVLQTAALCDQLAGICHINLLPLVPGASV